MGDHLRTVIVTGALRGLGFELSKKLILSGHYNVILTSRTSDKSEVKLQELKDLNIYSHVDYHKLDVTATPSIKEFRDWLHKKYTKYDVLVNNAGLKDSQTPGNTKGDKAMTVVTTNVNGVVDTTEILLPLLSDNGKIIISSGIVGKLQFQKKPIQDLLTNPAITKDEILNLASSLIEQMKNDKLEGWTKSPETAYFASKALINCYARYVLSKQLKPHQMVYSVHPGWCRTDLGGPKAPLSAEDGTKCFMKLIDDIPYEFNEKINGKFWDENGEVFDY